MPFALPAIGANLLWKIGGGVAIVATVVLAFLLFKTTMENRSLTKERDKLSLSITDPNTGYIARMTQLRTNTIVLQDAIKTQNAEYQRQSNEAKVNMDRLKKELASAQAQTRAAEKRLSAFLSKPPRGANLEQRVTDIDNRILEDLKK